MINEVYNESIDEGYEYFKGEFELLTGIKLNLYKEKQMKRRINTLIERKGLSNYFDFLNLLKSDNKELAAFIDYITINVTSFFRVLEHWKVFEEKVLARLVRNKQKIKIWSCACSTGEEPYSLAMSILSLDKNADFEIIATDIDENVILKAKRAIYNEMSFEEVSEDIKSTFFDIENNNYKVKDEVKKHVNFYRLDLFNDEYPMNCDVIVCRNVLIYFTEEGKDMIYKKFNNCLKSNGCLFTGNTEQIIYYKAYKFLKETNYIYYKEDRQYE